MQFKHFCISLDWPQSLCLQRMTTSKDDQKEEDAVEEEDRVCDQVPLVAYVETILKEPRGCDRGPQYDQDAEGNADWILQAEEERANGQGAEGQQRVAQYAHGRVQLHVDAFLGQQVNHEKDAQTTCGARTVDVSELVVSSLV